MELSRAEDLGRKNPVRGSRRLPPQWPADFVRRALTAHVMQGDGERCLAAGMDACLTKPVQAGALVAIVERLGIREAA